MNALSGDQPCWSAIGTLGRRSCPRLAEHIHCRNCPVFADGARSLFDRPAPAGYREQWTDWLAASPEAPDSDVLVLAVFRLGAEWFALPVDMLSEGLALRPWRRLPHRGDQALLGLVNVRGDVLPCVSLHAWLAPGVRPPSLQGHAPDRHPSLLVCGEGAQRFAFPVDEASGIERIARSTVSSPPATVATAQPELVVSTADLPSGRKVGLLDADLLLRRILDALT